MSWGDQWKQWHERKRACEVAERQATIAQARAHWLGRLVRYYEPWWAEVNSHLAVSQDGWVYGVVEDVEDTGWVTVAIAFWDDGAVRVRTVGCVTDLGSRFRLADGMP